MQLTTLESPLSRPVFIRIPLSFFVFLHCFVAPVLAASSLSDDVKNGRMEDRRDGDLPDSWTLTKNEGVRYELDTNQPFEGQSSLLVDTTRVPNHSKSIIGFGYQQIDATPFRGKRIQISACVRTDALKGPSRVQLFGSASKSPNTGGPNSFTMDDMSNRPIRDSDWREYHMVLDVGDDADAIFVGWKLIGIGRAWIDDVRLSEVGKEVSVTSSEGQSLMSRYLSAEMPPAAVLKAGAEAQFAPQQAFFNNWLWLFAVAILLFVLSSWPVHPNPAELTGVDDLPVSRGWQNSIGFALRFSFQFTVAYWLLFFSQITFGGFAEGIHEWLKTYYTYGADTIVYWVARQFFGIEGELVPAYGSGDTTYCYIEVLCRFGVALIIASVWFIVAIRRTEMRYAKDLFNSYLRYSLAACLLYYGLAKVAWTESQFPPLVQFQLEATWADCSPMGIVWRFMGASQPYVFFAGLGEIAGALLLIFRRTSVVGALVSIGVMTNVVMLNLCYDVPVKIFSIHLWVMSLMLLFGGGGVIRSLFFLRTSDADRSLSPPYLGAVNKWIYFATKLTLVSIVFIAPCWVHFSKQVKYLTEQTTLPEWLGEYVVDEFRLDGKIVTTDSHPNIWSSIYFQADEQGMFNSPFLMASLEEPMMLSTGFASAGESEFKFESNEYSTFPQGLGTVTGLGSKQIRLRGDALAGEIDVLMTRKTNVPSKLMERGFRWVNEAPYHQ